MLRSAGRILVIAATGLAIGACSSDSTGNSDGDAVAGVFTLQTIDGQALPVIVDQQGDDFAEVIQGSVTLEVNRNFEDLIVLRITLAGVPSTQSEVATGSWTLVGSSVRFTPDDGSSQYAMTWDGQDRLTQLFQGFVLVYER